MSSNEFIERMLDDARNRLAEWRGVHPDELVVQPDDLIGLLRAEVERSLFDTNIELPQFAAHLRVRPSGIGGTTDPGLRFLSINLGNVISTIASEATSLLFGHDSRHCAVACAKVLWAVLASSRVPLEEQDAGILLKLLPNDSGNPCIPLSALVENEDARARVDVLASYGIIGPCDLCEGNPVQAYRLLERVKLSFESD